MVEGKDGVLVHQLTSSGIVHTPPPTIALIAYEWLGRHHSRAPPEGAPAQDPRQRGGYLRRRNRLSLDAAGDGRFRATWHTEQGKAGSSPRPPRGPGRSRSFRRSGHGLESTVGSRRPDQVAAARSAAGMIPGEEGEARGPTSRPEGEVGSEVIATVSAKS